jgi:SSS family solute:Na+ symporter
VSEGFEVDGVAIAVFCVLFGFVTVLGFVAARWKRGDLGLLDEWGLGGRRFGTVITWFLLGGDLVTAYTFIAVPALVWAVGAGGFFALPYTILVFPFVFLVMPRLWAVASKVVLGGLGIEGHWPLIIAFAILAAYTYTSGLQAPAMIALVKDTLIYATVIVAIIYIRPSWAAGTRSSPPPRRSCRSATSPER